MRTIICCHGTDAPNAWCLLRLCIAEHKFRDPADVIYPLLHHGYMRGEGAAALVSISAYVRLLLAFCPLMVVVGHCFAQGIDLSIATQKEALELMLLSLSGVCRHKASDVSHLICVYHHVGLQETSL